MRPKYQARISARMVIGILEERTEPAREEDITALMNEIAPAVIGQQDPMEVFFNALPLEDKELLEPGHLYHTLTMTMIVFHGCGSQLTMSDDTRRKALYTLARLFQRWWCHGDLTALPAAFHRISEITLNCLR